MTGNELRMIRVERLGMRQTDLSEALGIPVETISRWERGSMAIRHPRMLELALTTLTAQTEWRNGRKKKAANASGNGKGGNTHGEG